MSGGETTMMSVAICQILIQTMTENKDKSLEFYSISVLFDGFTVSISLPLTASESESRWQ